MQKAKQSVGKVFIHNKQAGKINQMDEAIQHSHITYLTSEFDAPEN